MNAKVDETLLKLLKQATPEAGQNTPTILIINIDTVQTLEHLVMEEKKN